MITFKYPSDITKLPRANPAYPLIKEYIQRLMITADDMSRTWNPDDEGYLAILEPSDVNQNLGDVWHGLFQDIPFEGVFKRSGFYVAVFLANNSFGIVYLVEDAEWIDGPIREILNENLDP